jgi:hypothetical protein
MAKNGNGNGKSGGGQVIVGNAGDVLLINQDGDADGDSPAAILVPAKLHVTLGDCDDVWAEAVALEKAGKAKGVPIKTLQAISTGLTEITLLMDKEKKAPKPSPKPKAPKKAPKAAPKKKKK